MKIHLMFSKQNWLVQHLSPAMLACLLTALISGWLLFLPQIHGLADNGDFYRAMLSNGVYRLPLHYRQYLNYVVPKFGLLQYYNENNVAVFSSQTLFVKTAVFLNRLFYSKTIFDLRFLAGVYFIPYLFAIYFLTRSLVYPYRNLKSYLIALLIVFVFADSSFTLYFNSFFAEPGMLIAMLFAFAAIMSLVRHCDVKSWPMVTVFFLSTIILITNKQQNAPLALSFLVVAAGLLFMPKKHHRTLLLAVGMMAVLASGVVTYRMINQEFNDVNQYQAFTHGVLMETPDPSRQIEKGGINEQFALMRAQDYYPKNFASVKPSQKVVRKRLIAKYNYAWLVRYYAGHLHQFSALLDVAAKDLMITQVKAVGDYTKLSGARPGQQFTYFTLFSSVMGAFFPKRFVFLILLAVVFIGVYAVSAYLDFKAGRYEAIMRFLLVLGLMTIVIFVPIISIIGDGDADLAKHLFMVPVSLDLLFLLLISDALTHRLWTTHLKAGASNET